MTPGRKKKLWIIGIAPMLGSSSMIASAAPVVLSNRQLVDRMTVLLQRFETPDDLERHQIGSELAGIPMTGEQRGLIVKTFLPNLTDLLRRERSAGKIGVIAFCGQLGSEAVPLLPELKRLAARKQAPRSPGSGTVGVSVEQAAAAVVQKIESKVR